MIATRIALPALLLLAAAPASAQASGQDWNNWVYRANSLLRAIESGEKRDVDIMCRGIYGEMAGKGFPKWAQHLTTVCESLKEGLTKGRSSKFCSSARLAAAQLGGAAPVPEEPRAAPLALTLSRAMQGLYEGMCR